MLSTSLAMPTGNLTTMEPVELFELPSIAGTSDQKFDTAQSQQTSVLDLLSAHATNGNTTPPPEFTPEDTAASSTRHESSLGRVDGGFQAWSLVRQFPCHCLSNSLLNHH